MLRPFAIRDFSVETVYCPFAILSTERIGADEKSNRATLVCEFAIKFFIRKVKSGTVYGASLRGTGGKPESRPPVAGRMQAQDRSKLFKPDVLIFNLGAHAFIFDQSES